MTDTTAAGPVPVNNLPGPVAMSRLSDRLAAMVPPDVAATLAAQKQSAAVTAGLANAKAISARSARRVNRGMIAAFVDSFIYSLVALALRVVIARVFFLDGQTKVEGPRVPVNVWDFDFTLVLPFGVNAITFSDFMSRYTSIPLPPTLSAYLVSYAEFFLPIMLVLGFGSRFAALGLLVITAMIQIYVLPEALWTVHIYWISILMVLLSLGPGQISVDHIIRFIARR